MREQRQVRPKILVIDDDPDFVEATRVVLESGGYQVLAAYDGKAGLAKVRADRPDLVILDIIMPEEDGFKVCEALKADPELSKIPVIVLTSLSERWSEVTLSVTQGLKLEAEDYIDKPVEPEELLRRVEKRLKAQGQGGQNARL
ncbi:MAG: response regulator [Candidatus Acetothermia bacterium]|nr:response regulator [Candidatus Acetothermia bacterium]MDH7505403.1 response regulator [Candidatus Acetothermia bacterium]